MTVILFVGAALAFLIVRSMRLHRDPRHLLTLIPKAFLLLLFILALMDPRLHFMHESSRSTKIAILEDISSSMDLRDDGIQTRAERSADLIQKLKAMAPPHFEFQIFPFDTTIHSSNYVPKPGVERGTDLASVLSTPVDHPLLADTNGEIIITDGGDETVEVAKLTNRPLGIIGVGYPSENWCDIGVGNISAPAMVEEKSRFDIRANLYARKGTLTQNAEALTQIKVILEQFGNGGWKEIESQIVNLTFLHALANFELQVDGEGAQLYRISIPQLPAELTYANNARTVRVEIEKRAVHVLYFTQELGVDYKYLRNELISDPGMLMTAMFRVVQDQFTVQGDRTGYKDLLNGFPTKLEILKRYDCIVLGSFPAKLLSDAQQDNLVNYVREGGAVIFLGGNDSFGLGGYADSKLAPLFPWNLQKRESAMAQGNYAIDLAETAGSVNFTDGWGEQLAKAGGATLESVNCPGGLRPGALALLVVNLNGQNQPVVATQRFGKGQVLGIASNTFWKWATSSEALHLFYGKFLRQSVRGLTQRQEGGSVLGVHWNHDRYRPGELAEVSIRLQDSNESGDLRLTGSLQTPDGEKTVSIDPMPGETGNFLAKVQFQERGDYTFHLHANRGAQVAESYTRNLSVEPSIEEGADPELKEAFLQDVAARTRGVYCNEKDIQPMAAFLREQAEQQVSDTILPLVGFWDIFTALVLLILLCEWFLRRRFNLV